MQPFNRFSMSMSLDRSQILIYTTDFHFFPVQGGRFVDMQTFQISIPEIAKYLCLHLSPVYYRSLIQVPVMSIKRIYYLPSAQIIKDVVEL